MCWGHSTGVVEENTETFASNWAGTGAISGSGDAETLCLSSGQYMNSNVVYTGERTTRLRINVYDTGDTVTIKYQTGTTEANCLVADWNTYTTPFESLGYVRMRLEVA